MLLRIAEVKALGEVYWGEAEVGAGEVVEEVAAAAAV